MRKNFFVIFTFLCLMTSHNTVGREENIDELLGKLIKVHQLKPLPTPKKGPKEQVRLGAMLFKETGLSGHHNISCMHCHHPRLGTSDNLPFSIGEGGLGPGKKRKQSQGIIIKRHSPHLINPKRKDITSIMTTALSAQTIFPLTSPEEKRRLTLMRRKEYNRSSNTDMQC